MVEFIFIGSLLAVIYIYVGYPALVFVLSKLFRRPVRKAGIPRRVSIIIAAYNEERDIAEKIENTLAMDYPREMVEVIVASDCSSDRTDEITRSFELRGVRLCRSPQRLGKTIAQDRAVRTSSGDILVFSDATTMYQPDVLRKVVRNFADPSVGCVAGQLVYIARSEAPVGRGCRSYWNYEKFLKKCESDLYSLIGVSGCLYAVRRSSYARMRHDMSSDFAVASEMHLQGLRTIYEPEAIATETTNERGREEFKMRVRVIEQTLGALYRYREVLSLSNHGLFAFQMISHKLLRYAVPLLLILIFLSNAALVNRSSVYSFLIVAQTAFYASAGAGWLAERVGFKLSLLGLPYYFVLANLASAVAFVGFMRGSLPATWEPARPAGANSPRAAAEGRTP